MFLNVNYEYFFDENIVSIKRQVHSYILIASLDKNTLNT